MKTFLTTALIAAFILNPMMPNPSAHGAYSPLTADSFQSAERRQKVQNALYASMFEDSVTSTQRYEKLAIIALLNRAYEANPSVVEGNDFASTMIRTFEDWAPSSQPDDPYDVFKSAQNLMKSTGAIAKFLPGLDFVFEVIAADNARYRRQFESAIPENAFDQTPSLQEVLRAQAALAANNSRNPGFRATLVNINLDLFGDVDPSSSPEKMLASNPVFAEKNEIGALMKEVLAGRADLSDLRGAAEKHAQEVSSAIQGLRNDVADLGKKTDSLVEAILANSKAEQARNQKLILEAQRLSNTQNAMILLAQFSAFMGDTKTAQRIEIVSTVAVSVYSSINNYIVSSSDLGNAANTMSSAALTGNLLAAGIQLFSLFNSAQSPDQALLNQMRALQEQMADISSLLINRFARIDQRLAFIHSDMILELNRAQGDLTHTKSLVKEAIAALQGQYRKLNLLERRLMLGVRDGFNRPFVEAQLNCLKNPSFQTSKAKHNQTKECLDTFHAFATQHSRDRVSTTPSVDPVGRTFQQLATDLEATPEDLDASWSQLKRLASHLYRYPLLPGAQNLANPSEWEEASRSYLSLLESAGDYRKHVGINGLLEVQAAGLELNALSEAITRASRTGTFQESYDGSLIHAVSEQYRNTLKDVSKMAQSILDHAKVGLKGYQASSDIEATDRPEFDGNIKKCESFSWSDKPLRKQLSPSAYDLIQEDRQGHTFDKFVISTHFSEEIAHATRMVAHLGLEGSTTYSACVNSIGWESVSLCKGERKGNSKFAYCGFPSVTFHIELGPHVVLSKTLTGDQVVFLKGEYSSRIVHGEYRETERYTSIKKLSKPVKRLLLGSSPPFDAEGKQPLAARHEGMIKQLKANSRAAATDAILSSQLFDELTVHAKMLKLLVTMGLPRSIDESDALRTLIAGSEQLIEGDELKAAHVKDLRSFTTIGSDGSVELKRLQAFDQVMGSIYDSGKASQTHPRVANILKWVEMAKDALVKELPKRTIAEVIRFVRSALDASRGFK